MKGTRRLEFVSEGSSGEDPEIVGMHVMATNAPHELDRVNLDAKGKHMFRGFFLQTGRSFVDWFRFETARICFQACGRRRDGGKTGGHLRHMNQGVKQPDDGLGSMRKKQSIYSFHKTHGEADSNPGQAFGFPLADVRSRRMKAWGGQLGSPYAIPEMIF